MKLPDKVYDILKWIVIILIPAAVTLYGTLAPMWNWPYATEIAKTAAGIETFLGAVIGISTIEYNKTK